VEGLPDSETVGVVLALLEPASRADLIGEHSYKPCQGEISPNKFKAQGRKRRRRHSATFAGGPRSLRQTDYGGRKSEDRQQWGRSLGESLWIGRRLKRLGKGNKTNSKSFSERASDGATFGLDRARFEETTGVFRSARNENSQKKRKQVLIREPLDFCTRPCHNCITTITLLVLACPRDPGTTFKQDILGGAAEKHLSREQHLPNV